MASHLGAPRAVDRGEDADASEGLRQLLRRSSSQRCEGHPGDEPELPHAGEVRDRGVERVRGRVRVARWRDQQLGRRGLLDEPLVGRRGPPGTGRGGDHDAPHHRDEHHQRDEGASAAEVRPEPVQHDSPHGWILVAPPRHGRGRRHPPRGGADTPAKRWSATRERAGGRRSGRRGPGGRRSGRR